MAAETHSLSASTARSINWSNVNRTITDKGLSPQRGETNQLPPDYAQRVREAFAVAKNELNTVAVPLRRQLSTMLWIVFPALGIAAGGGSILAVYRHDWAGELLTGGSLAALFGLMARAWRLGRDQVILENIPASYETLFALATDTRQHELVFQAFLQELVALRRNLGRD